MYSRNSRIKCGLTLLKMRNQIYDIINIIFNHTYAKMKENFKTMIMFVSVFIF